MFAQIPPATRYLILANVALYLLQSLLGETALDTLALWPLGHGFAPWQVLTYAFLHGGWAHIFFNMFALYMFGGALEQTWGSGRFLLFYFASVLAAAAAQLVVTSLTGSIYPTVGASGGIFGVLLGYAMYFPQRRVMLIFPPIPLPAWLFVTLYGALELFLGVTGTAEGVAHFAHLGGMLGGWLTILSWRGRPGHRLGRDQI
ncbi:MAG: rhomboid family intramembrane serine protease [Steroidobacteraceae bacterium]